MIVGIFVSLLAIFGIGVVSVLKGRNRWPFKLWPAILGLSLLAIGGLWEAGSAQATPKSTTLSSSSSSKPLVNNGKLALDGKTFTADFDRDDTYTLEVPVKAGYKTADFKILPDPDRQSKYAVSSSKQAVADSISASSSLAESKSVSASESKSASSSISASASIEASWSRSESIAASESVVASSKAAAASAKAEANKYNTGITYDQLARDPDTYMGKLLHLTGKVIQVVEGDTETDLRVAIDGDYNNVVLVVYDPTTRSTRILEDDKVTFYGLSLGTQSYTSTLGGKITVPLVQADKIDDSGTAPSDYGY